MKQTAAAFSPTEIVQASDLLGANSNSSRYWQLIQTSAVPVIDFRHFDNTEVGVPSVESE